MPDLTRIEAWSRYIEFLSDAAHAHAPSTVSIEPVGNVNNTYAIEGRVSFDDGTEALATTDTVLSQKDEANGKLGWWHIDDPSFGSTVTLTELDNLRSVRVGDVSIDNPQGWYYLFPGSYRIEAVPQNPDYWTIKYEYPLTDGAGEIRTNPITRPYTIEANDTLKEWVREQSEVFATSCRTGTPDASREDACGALAYSTTPFDPTQDYLSVDLVGTTSFLLAVSTGETAPTDDGHTHYNARFKCTIDFAYDGATPTTECTLDK